MHPLREPTSLDPALELLPVEVGLVLQLPLNENARLGLPNKLFEYLMAGLAVVVPDGGAMAGLVSSEGVGLAYEAGSASDLAAALTRLADDPALVSRLRESTRQAARTRYNAAVDEPLLARAWGVAG